MSTRSFPAPDGKHTENIVPSPLVPTYPVRSRANTLLLLAGYTLVTFGLFTWSEGPGLVYGILGLTMLAGVLFVLTLRPRAGPAVHPPAGPPPDYDAVAAKLDEIEAELKRMGAWQAEPPPPEVLAFRQPFAMDTMAFEQWLQFVLLPRAREIIARRETFPPHSAVAVHAVREFDGRDDTARLFDLLHEFDRLFGPPRFYGAT